MTALRILLIDDDADIREIITVSLGLDPELSVRGCASGAEGLAANSRVICSEAIFAL